MCEKKLIENFDRRLEDGPNRVPRGPWKSSKFWPTWQQQNPTAVVLFDPHCRSLSGVA